MLISKPMQSPEDLVSGILIFAFSFVIVVWIWNGYTRTMAVLPFEVRGTYLLNLVLLFCVAIEPYLLFVLFSPGSAGLLEFASAVYAIDAGAMMWILAGMVRIVLREEAGPNARRLPALQLARLRGVMWAESVSGLLFILSALPTTWVEVPTGAVTTFLRFDTWYANFAIFFPIASRGRARG